MTAIKALIAKVEKAEGPDLELDKAILEAVHPLPESFFGSKVTARKFHLREIDYETEDGNYHSHVGTVPRFTASIDCALTLVPDGVSFELARYADQHAYVNLWSRADPITPFGRGKIRVQADGKTPAIALCIAALRAIEAEARG